MAIFNLFRRSYLLLQVVAIMVWLGLELAGYGFGLLDGVLGRRLTNAEAPRIAVTRPARPGAALTRRT